MLIKQLAAKLISMMVDSIRICIRIAHSHLALKVDQGDRHDASVTTRGHLHEM